MANIFKDIELAIFDLDGTLYEDTDHFNYYADQLMQELPESLHTSFQQEYAKMLDGDHIVTIGKVYDVVRDQVLKLDPLTSVVQEAWTWNGEAVNQNEVKEQYPHPLNLDFDTMIAVGDGWWLPNVCARHYGAKDTQRPYVKTKDYMATDEFHLTKIAGLREALLNLGKSKSIVLLTNSEKDDVERLLNNLNLANVFEDIVTGARKPQYTKNHLAKLLEKYKIDPIQAISIGDNYINEIAPAINLGMQTAFIDFYELEYPEYQGLKVKSISDLIENMMGI